MSVSLKKEEQSDFDMIVQKRQHERRVNISQEIPWIKQLQKHSKTKGMIDFNKQITRPDFVESNSKSYARANEERFQYKQIPKIYSRYTSYGQAVIPYDKQLPAHKLDSIFKYSTLEAKDEKSVSMPKIKQSHDFDTLDYPALDNIDTLASS